MSSSVSFNPRDPNSLLRALAERENARYESDYIPVEDQAIASLDDTSLVKRARQSTVNGFSRSVGRFNRDLSRYGVAPSAADRENSNLRFSFDAARTSADTVNNSRLDQFDRNRSVRGELINIGRSLANESFSNVSEAAGLQTSRENNNRAASASSKAGLLNLGGQVASAALYSWMV